MSNFWGAVQKLDFLCLTFGVQYKVRFFMSNFWGAVHRRWIFLQAKFETKARILAMRLAMRGCWRPSLQKEFFLFEFYVRNIIIIFH